MTVIHAPQRDERPGDSRPAGLPVGREAEVDRLRAFLTAARADGGALLITGEPGFGMTELLNAVTAAGTRILRAAGVHTMSSSSGSGPELDVLRLWGRQRPDAPDDVDEEGRWCH